MALTDEERKLMNDVLDELNEYLVEKASEFKAFLFEGDWFLDFCKEYKKGGDNTGLELGFLIIYDMWVNNSNVWPVYMNEYFAKD